MKENLSQSNLITFPASKNFELESKNIKNKQSKIDLSQKKTPSRRLTDQKQKTSSQQSIEDEIDELLKEIEQSERLFPPKVKFQQTSKIFPKKTKLTLNHIKIGPNDFLKKDPTQELLNNLKENITSIKKAQHKISYYLNEIDLNKN